ncbi:nitrate reductase associated protein (plasmid) [Agrobacterium leguminum]|uniref:Nitrate reductase associated protein n=1 Tax=Agrobacterium deltaense NCPPB 1641 TaxID=1183425 RepID=A0A1S7U9E3_9HYPH|nr:MULTISPECIES: nitrate reductase associated protein [Agrobacterium]WFS70115.1 nitrate reductase associated protein [Agrobacterium leguminum]CVI63554.1 conserved hypothetical protein [Agrobacterium deltaense NCPPB 1641]
MSASAAGNRQIFDFELDFANTLRCVPMAVRRKLDLVGVKLSLRQWSQFKLEDRASLLELACETTDEIEKYRETLVELIGLRTRGSVTLIDVVNDAEWMNISAVPEAVIREAEAKGHKPPLLSQWAGLTDLQRFALLKLTRSGHDNENFVPALREFDCG